jgi:hypothetical protein
VITVLLLVIAALFRVITVLTDGIAVLSK